ncbi:hypothetical protein [Isoptericola cucumis]|uniref:Integral membrane protein n=1 Tax=Isoptericola cucumis TaxID=1776856 RepID=A0ABQ2B3P7_9MICO|nr:hypothetical protein [Isoptericola cucumis]GGI07208.1 hypothetical protein GCM10007368_15020 [Isoptericola cucumis]
MTALRARTLLLTTLPALAAGGLLAGLGVLDAVHAALLVVVVAAVVYVWRTLEEGEDAGWPPVPEARRAGARNDVSELGWATFTRNGAVGNRMRARIVALAAARLAEHGVDLGADGPGDRAAAERLLGPDVVATMTSRGEATRAQVERWLDAVERLAPPTPDPDGRHAA